MKPTSFFRFALSCCVALIATAAFAQPAPTAPPTMAEIQQAFDAKQYTDVIKKAQQALAMKGNAAVGYDREKLFILRGESQLRTKAYVPAAEAFTSAAKETKDEKNITLYNATAILIKKSTAGKYQPKQPTTQAARAGAKAEPIDIAETATRKEALLALYNDESKLAAPKLETAARQTALKPLIDSLKQVGDLRTLELAATGKDVNSQKLVSALGGRASELMTTELKRMSADVDAISKNANLSTSTIAMGQTVQIKNGLNSTDKNKLNDVIETCKQVMGVCDQLSADVSKQTGAAPKDVFATVKADAVMLNNHTIEVLQADYGQGTQVTTDQEKMQQTNPYQQNQPTNRGARTGTGRGTPR